MQPRLVMHAADQRDLMHQLRHVRQMLADVDARRRGCNGLELAPHLRRCVRLHVIGVDMARTAIVEDQDAGADRLRPRGRWSGDRLGAPEPTESQTEIAGAAKLQQPTAREETQRIGECIVAACHVGLAIDVAQEGRREGRASRILASRSRKHKSVVRRSLWPSWPLLRRNRANDELVSTRARHRHLRLGQGDIDQLLHGWFVQRVHAFEDDVADLVAAAAQ